MRRKESKVPLVVAFIVLTYIVFWGFGYAKKHQPTPVEPAVAQIAVQPQPQPAAQPSMVATQGASTEQPGENLMTKHAPTNPVPDPYESEQDGGSLEQHAAFTQNRKLAGITDIAGKKH